MSEYPGSLERLINTLSKLPGIGPRMAERLAFHILKMSDDNIKRLSFDLVDLKEKIKNCSICGTITEIIPCGICQSYERDSNVLCVVEQSQDVFAIERTREFRGKYHVLGGVLSPLDGIGPDDLRIKELISRVENENIKEIIIATNPTVSGEATSIYLSKLLKPHVLKITRIAHGVPVGADLEYTDGITIVKALEGRREI